MSNTQVKPFNNTISLYINISSVRVYYMTDPPPGLTLMTFFVCP